MERCSMCERENAQYIGRNKHGTPQYEKFFDLKKVNRRLLCPLCERKLVESTKPPREHPRPRPICKVWGCFKPASHRLLDECRKSTGFRSCVRHSKDGKRKIQQKDQSGRNVVSYWEKITY